MNAIVGTMHMLARKIDTFEFYAAAGTTYWLSTTSYRAVVPTGKRWKLLYGFAHPNASATVTVYLYNSDDEVLGSIAAVAAGTALVAIPNTAASSGTLKSEHIILNPGGYVQVTFGAAQNTSSYANLSFLEVDV